MTRRVLFGLALLCGLGVARSSLAHHPLAELFDRDSTVVIEGTIASIAPRFEVQPTPGR